MYTKLKMKISCYQEHYHKDSYHETEHVDSEEPPENSWSTPTALTRKGIIHIILEGKQHCSLISFQFIKA